MIPEDGEVWSCGQNHRGQLGLGHTSDVSTLHPGPALKQRVVNVSCGWDFTLFLTGKPSFYMNDGTYTVGLL